MFYLLTFRLLYGKIRHTTKRKVGDMMANPKQTSPEVASKASKILKDGRYGKDSKAVAGSALSQTRKPKNK